jgi:predicted nucleic acid-binding Zn ribbon protein
VQPDDELDELQVALSSAPPSELASLLDRVVRGMGAPGTDAVELVFNRWADVVGTVLATRTRPVSLERSTLVLQADDPAVVSHVRWLEQDLVARMAELLGPGRVTAVEVRVARPGVRARRP